MDRLDVQLFGRLTLRRNGQVLPPIESIKAQELLSYLVLNGSRSHSRERLADILWGESQCDQGRKYLRQALWHLQAAVHADEAADDEALLVVDSVWVGLNTNIELVVDATEMERAFTLVREIPGSAFDDHAGATVRHAVELYQGELLEGWYYDWCIFERERMQTMYLILLDKLLGYSEARGEYESGIVYGHRILQVDHAREHTHRAIMRLYALSGDRTSALRQFRTCRDVLHEELDVTPTKHTVELAEQIRSERFPPNTTAGTLVPITPSPLAQTSLDDVEAHLAKVRAALSDVAEQLARDIAIVHAYPRDSNVPDGPIAGRHHGRQAGDASADTDPLHLPY